MSRPLLEQAAEAMSDGEPKAALDALLHWGNQKFDRRTSTLTEDEARDAALDLVGALAEVAYLLDDPTADAHRDDGADAVEYLARYGDEPRIPVARSEPRSAGTTDKETP
jgi:excinuclease UvrABC ATPase subunit